MPSIPERGYPLSALFLLMAASAAPMSMAAAAGRAIAQRDITGQQFAFAALGGCAAMMLLGALIGLHHHRQGIGVVLGSLAGAILGSMAGPIVLVPRYDFGNLMIISAGASAVMVIGAAWLHYRSGRHRRTEPPAWFSEDDPFQPTPQNPNDVSLGGETS
jgi:hypothetical protein